MMEEEDVRTLVKRHTSILESMCLLLHGYTERTLALEKAFEREKKKRQLVKKKAYLLSEIILSSEGFDTSSPNESGTGSPPPSPMEPSQDC